MKIMIVKEVMTGDVSPVAMFYGIFLWQTHQARNTKPSSGRSGFCEQKFVIKDVIYQHKAENASYLVWFSD